MTDNAAGHNKLAEFLIEKEVIFAEDLEKIFGKRPWTSRNDELMAQNPEVVEIPESTTESTDVTEKGLSENNNTDAK